MRKISLPLGLAVALSACGALLPPVSPMQAEWAAQHWSGMDEPKLSQARALYVNRCSGCHNLILPATHNMGDWEVWVSSMAVRAKLSDGDQVTILRYIETVKSVPN